MNIVREHMQRVIGQTRKAQEEENFVKKKLKSLLYSVFNCVLQIGLLVPLAIDFFTHILVFSIKIFSNNNFIKFFVVFLKWLDFFLQLLVFLLQFLDPIVIETDVCLWDIVFFVFDLRVSLFINRNFLKVSVFLR